MDIKSAHMGVNTRLKPAFPVARPMRSTHTFTQCHPTADWDGDPELCLLNGKPK